MKSKHLIELMWFKKIKTKTSCLRMGLESKKRERTGKYPVVLFQGPSVKDKVDFSLSWIYLVWILATLIWEWPVCTFLLRLYGSHLNPQGSKQLFPFLPCNGLFHILKWCFIIKQSFIIVKIKNNYSPRNNCSLPPLFPIF